KEKLNIDVRLFSEVVSIDTVKKSVSIKETQTGREYTESYDKLVLATGSQPVRPNLPGIDLPGIYTLRTIPDANQIKQWITVNNVKDAVVVGGGLIGLEMTENLVMLGVKVTIVEMLPNLVPFFDPEMAVPLHDALRKKGVDLRLSTAVRGFIRNEKDSRITIQTEPDAGLSCDLVILSIGSRPENTLAREAGLEIGSLSGIRVNEQMQTSDKDVYAVGDVVESKDIITGEWILSLLASPANRQARVAADNIFGRERDFHGVQMTAVCRLFDTDIASTGVSEKTLKRIAERGNIIPYDKVYIHPRNHADYYPGSSEMAVKMIYEAESGRILGAQAIGGPGVEKRIDVIAMAIQMGATVYDLEEAELCYSPQFGSAKEVANILGMVTTNILKGDIPTIHWEKIDTDKVFLLDPRGKEDFDAGHVNGAVNIPLEELRDSLDTFDRNKTIYVYCNQGKTSYSACRILLLNGFDCVNISGGYKTYKSWSSLGNR
ncbi:MAG: FAD-dependent oxidoreductase, partial [Dehalococcoidales bacterium]|nr:FAD-dependent oxidoreductase [Dehalococcoidales bacterium]